jgi:hypothetical protein
MLIRRARNSARITAAHSTKYQARSISRALKENTARHTISRATRGRGDPPDCGGCDGARVPLAVTDGPILAAIAELRAEIMARFDQLEARIEAVAEQLERMIRLYGR